ncbi:hypothetical protein ACLOJK_023210 [Asimina triloba]
MRSVIAAGDFEHLSYRICICRQAPSAANLDTMDAVGMADACIRSLGSTVAQIFIFDIAARCVAGMMRMASVDLGFCWFTVEFSWRKKRRQWMPCSPLLRGGRWLLPMRSLMEETTLSIGEEAPTTDVATEVAGFDVVVVMVDEDDGGIEIRPSLPCFEWLGSVNGRSRRSSPPAAMVAGH